MERSLLLSQCLAPFADGGREAERNDTARGILAQPQARPKLMQRAHGASRPPGSSAAYLRTVTQRAKHRNGGRGYEAHLEWASDCRIAVADRLAERISPWTRSFPSPVGWTGS